MTPEQLREAAAVMLAAADGKVIQWRWKIGREDARMTWCDMSRIGWDFEGIEYRIKPEPRKVKVAIYVNPADGYHLPIMEVDVSRFQSWKRVSDIVEIEVME